MACKFIKNARQAALDEGLDPTKINCRNRQGNCVDGQGCADIQDLMESYQRPMFVFEPGEVTPKDPVVTFYSRLERHDSIVNNLNVVAREREF